MSALVESAPASPQFAVGSPCRWRGITGKIEAWQHCPHGLCYYVSGLVINGVARTYWLDSEDVSITTTVG